MLLCLLSAVLLYLSFPNILFQYGFAPLAWFFAVPLFAALNGRPLWKRLLVGVVFSAAAYGLLVNWLVPIYPAGFFMFAGVLSVQSIFFCLLFKEGKNPVVNGVYLGSLWAASEFLRTVSLKGFCWSIGYSQSFFPAVLQPASVTGVYGIAWFIIFINYLIYYAYKNPAQRVRWGLAAFTVWSVVVVAGIIFIFFSGKRPSETLSVCAVQPNILSYQKWDARSFDQNIEQHVRLTHQCSVEAGADMVIWPETAFPDDLLEDPKWYPKIRQLASHTQAYLLTGAALSIGENYYNSAVLIGRDRNLKGIYHKQILVPFSEYPLFEKSFTVGGGLLRWGGYHFIKGTRLGLFETSFPGKSAQSLRFGTVICSEDFYPGLFKQMKSEGMVFGVVLLNDSWFIQKAAPMMHAQSDILRAVEYRIPIVRAANTGWTCFIDAFGRVDAKRSPGLRKSGYGMFRVPMERRHSFYAQIGDFFAYACIGFVIMHLILRVITRWKKTS